MWLPRPFSLALVTALALALSGCAGDDGGTDPTDTTTPGTTGTGSPTGTGGPGGGDPTPMGPIYVNGTVTGALDCTVMAQGGPTTGGDTQSLPPEAANGTYALSKTEDAAGTATLCVVFDDGTTGNSGTVPAAATSFTVYADLAEGVGYSVRIDPVL